jgi:N-acetylmuramoyl-L-alanine amidase
MTLDVAQVPGANGVMRKPLAADFTKYPARFGLLVLGIAVLAGCRTTPRPGTIEARQGDEIVVAGQFVHTGTPVVLWMDPGGYDAYRVQRRFSPLERAGWDESLIDVWELNSPNRYNVRTNGLTPEEAEHVRGGGWDLPRLQKVVDQFVIHFDVCGVSRQCFKVLHDHRDLSVHFMLDLDGTIYQTLDLKERAWHATTSNGRSVGIEIANMGDYSSRESRVLEEWYSKGPDGKVSITIPKSLGDGGVRTKGFVGHPARPEAVRGNIQGHDVSQYDFTPEQYKALIQLTATLCTVFPKIKCDYPRDSSGKLIPRKLADDELQKYQGVMGHYHIQTNKTDPGPAFQWDYVIGGARKLLDGQMAETSRGHMRERF